MEPSRGHAVATAVTSQQEPGGRPAAVAATVVVRDIMTEDVVTASPETTLREAAELLAAGGIGGLPVVTADRIVGVVSIRDLVDFSAFTPGVPAEREDSDEWSEWAPPDEWEEGGEPPAVYFLELWLESGADLVDRFASDAGPEWDILDEHVVAEVMTRTLVTVAPDTAVPEAARHMVRSAVHRLLVVESGRLLGVVTATDLLRAFAGEPAVNG